jgi:hypothetical protein
VWAVSPAVVGISAIARQYDLVALTSVLLVWGVLRVTATPGGRVTEAPCSAEAAEGAAAAEPGGVVKAAPGGARRWAALAWPAAATAAALLTHYQAALLVAGAAVYVLVAPRLWRRKRPRSPAWPPLLALGVGVAVAALASDWTQALGNERAMLVTPSFTGLVGKLAGLGDSAGQAVGAPGTLAALAALALVVAFAVPRSRRALLTHLQAARPGWWTIAFFLAVTAGAIVLQNLLFLSMPLRLSPRYLAMAWPFAAFLPLAAFGLWPRLRPLLTAALCVLLAVLSVVALPAAAGDPLQIVRLAGADAVVVDGVGIGRLPRFLWPVPAETPVFVGDTEQILASAVSTRELRAGEHLYYVDLSGTSDASSAEQDAILTAYGRATDVLLLDQSESARIFLITPVAAE